MAPIHKIIKLSMVIWVYMFSGFEIYAQINVLLCNFNSPVLALIYFYRMVSILKYVVASDVVNGTCDPDWLQFRDKCISFSSSMKYGNALKYCQGINSSLVEIDSAEKEAFIGNSISDPSTTYWLGLVDLVGNDDFNDHIWVQSNRSVIATGYQNWGPYDPDNKFHRCVISSNLPPYVWLDRNCEDTYNTICEKNSMKDIMASSTVGYPMSSTAGFQKFHRQFPWFY
ncbi:uncharacterized protein TRIADDRAFT_62274 [Trichoplax adhaerens]|uniref:C-type lectin domain-containing protein n=1 Tax=Trichoplax adhaerens TaxID=10228 RepID=B3SDB6_TRIAD|nr:hypothetical protein TRIADDRAFT_62274 [Trichoplax adhaerens]EDV19292.1 hypothetical protein TRIADDRAFT_62274 [Trichoplax adhaerens]|eukprot:XP_002118216.1 hypothetical protein TRIADDRAFT_62274 [Trichoplax adhaerens]